MSYPKSSKSFCFAALLSIGLVACGDSAEDGDVAASAQPGSDATAAAALTLAENGADACFKAAAEAFGADTKVSTLSATFGVADLEQYAVVETPVGELKSCSLDYQDPDNANKLLRATMDKTTGEFGEPEPIEISVIGNAADFSLDNIVIPLSQINTSGMAGTIDAQQAKLDEIFSNHALQAVRLQSPGPARAEHLISIDFAGRLKSNEVLDKGSVGLKTDGSVEYNNIGK